MPILCIIQSANEFQICFPSHLKGRSLFLISYSFLDGEIQIRIFPIHALPYTYMCVYIYVYMCVCMYLQTTFHDAYIVLWYTRYIILLHVYLITSINILVERHFHNRFHIYKRQSSFLSNYACCGCGVLSG